MARRGPTTAEIQHRHKIRVYDTTTTSGTVVPATAPRKMPPGIGRPGGAPVHACRRQGGSDKHAGKCHSQGGRQATA